MAPNRILCVAEKPSIAKAVSQHLAGGQVNVVGCVAQCYIIIAHEIAVEKRLRKSICKEL